MPPEISQISNWLKAARKAAGLTQEAVLPLAGVKLGVVQNSEQTGSTMAENFLALVAAYGVEWELAAAIDAYRQRGAWPAFRPLSAPMKRNVNQEGATAVPTPLIATEPVAKKGARRAGGSRRSR